MRHVYGGSRWFVAPGRMPRGTARNVGLSLIVGLFSFLAGALGTVRAAELTGVVRDAQGFAMVDARIELQVANDTQERVRTAASDGRGEFRLSGLERGAYIARAYASGFQVSALEVALQGDTAAVEFRLEPAAIHDGVVVTASRNEIESTGAVLPTAVLTATRLQEQVPTNLAQAMAEIPGVTWLGAGPFRSRPVIRGLDSNRILVLVDGERLNNNRTATNNAGIETSLIDISDIEQVEVVRGPGSVLYGSDAFGGVVNIRTRISLPRDQLGVRGKLGAALYPNSRGERGNAEVGVGNRWFSARARASAGNIDNYRAPDGMTVFGSSADEHSVLGELRMFAPGEQTASLKFLHREVNNFGLPSLDPNPGFLATFPFSKLNKYSGSYSKRFASAALSSVQVSAYTQNQHRDFRTRIAAGPGALISSSTVTDVQSTGFDVQGTSLPSPEHLLVYGASYYRDRNRDFRLQQMSGAGPQPRILSEAPSVPNASFSGTGFLVQDQWQATRRLRLIGGLRVDRFDLNTKPTPGFDPSVEAEIAGSRTDAALGGNVGASFNLGAGWSVTGNVGRAFRAPNLFERFFFGRGSVGGFIVPNPGLDPETSWQVESGVQYRSGPAKVAVNYFNNSLSNLISSAPGAFAGQSTLSGQPVFQNVNIEDARIYGLETTAEASVERFGSRWTPIVTAAWQRGTNKGNDDPLPLIAPFIGQARLRWSPLKSRVWSEFISMLVTSSDRAPPGQTPIRGFATFGWRSGYELVRGEYGLGRKLPKGISSVRVYGGVENVGNRTYFGLFESVPQPGQDVRFGMDLVLDSSAR